MNRMFKDRGADRITVAEVLAHPWLAGELGPADAVLVADLQRRKLEVRRQKAEEKEKAMRAKEAERRYVVFCSATCCWPFVGCRAACSRC